MSAACFRAFQARVSVSVEKENHSWEKVVSNLILALHSH
jgi:hypothetical protein